MLEISDRKAVVFRSTGQIMGIVHSNVIIRSLLGRRIWIYSALVFKGKAAVGAILGNSVPNHEVGHLYLRLNIVVTGTRGRKYIRRENTSLEPSAIHAEIALPQRPAITLTFLEGYRVAGRGPVNLFFAGYHLAD